MSVEDCIAADIGGKILALYIRCALTLSSRVDMTIDSFSKANGAGQDQADESLCVCHFRSLKVGKEDVVDD